MQQLARDRSYTLVHKIAGKKTEVDEHAIATFRGSELEITRVIYCLSRGRILKRHQGLILVV